MCDIYWNNTILISITLQICLVVLVLALIFAVRKQIKPVYWFVSPMLVIAAIWLSFDIDTDIYRSCLDGDSGASGDGLIFIFTLPAAFALFVISILALWKIQKKIPK